ncbi:MAG: DUF3106 domain-containing protein [Opitutales bacterium]
MKSRTLLYTLCLCLCGTGYLTAENNRESTRATHGESRMLMHLLQMDDAELSNLRKAVERIEAMSPEERARMRKRLGQLNKMSPERRQALRQAFEAVPPEKREAMHQRWKQMSPEDRRSWRRKLRGMTPEEQAEALQKGDLMPHFGR